MGINIFITPSAVTTYGLLMLSIATLWIPADFDNLLMKKMKLWSIPFILSLIFGIIFGFVQIIAYIPIALLGAACYLAGKESIHKKIKIMSGLFILLLSGGLMAHIVPGFSNFNIISKLVISKDAIPYTQYLNFDKAVVGLFILAFTHKLLCSRKEWTNMIKGMIPISIVTIVIVMIISLAIEYVRFDLTVTHILLNWFLPNLFFTCVAEESFFRGFIQKNLVFILGKLKYGTVAGLLIASVLFGFAHFVGGVSYIFLATVAGFGYGLAYHNTKSIEASIVTHFLLNIVHFTFFTYPALAKII